MKSRTFVMCLFSLVCLVATARADINFFPSYDSDGGKSESREGEEGVKRRDHGSRLPFDMRADLTAALGKDFIGKPSFNQAVDALGDERPLFGFGWEVIMDHVGFGAQYLVSFHEDDPDSWWLDWNGQPAFVSYHLFGARSVIDPFVEGGIGCAGRVFLGPEEGEDWQPRLDITIYPFVGAGAALCLDHFKIGAKLDYALGRSGVPATDIAEYPLGRFQVSVLAGVTFGTKGRE
jgi:hypothetical protein